MRRLLVLCLLLAAGCRARPEEDWTLEWRRRGKGTPAEYAAAQLGGGLPRAAMHFLEPGRMKEEYFKFGATADAARALLEGQVRMIERGLAWPEKEPREYELPYGDDWDRALVFPGEVPLDRFAEPSGNARWRFRHDGENLHFRVEIEDDHIEVDPKQPYLADSVEIFLSADERLPGYWEIVAAPDCPLFSAFHLVNHYGARGSRYRVGPDGLRCRAERVPGGFVVEGAFPLSALPSLSGPLPNPRARLTLMAVRINRVNEKVEKTAPVPLLYDGHNLRGHLRIWFSPH